jgi:hypothetical protein
MAEPAEKYHSFLLRLWQPTSQQGRFATLIDVRQPGEARHFSSLEALCLYLNECMLPQPTAATGDDE